MDNAQNPTGPVLTAAESRRRVLHNMCSSLLYNLSVILFGLLLPRLYLTSFGSELNGLDSTIKQIFSCLTLLEAGVGKIFTMGTDTRDIVRFLEQWWAEKQAAETV